MDIYFSADASESLISGQEVGDVTDLHNLKSRAGVTAQAWDADSGAGEYPEVGALHTITDKVRKANYLLEFCKP